MCVVVIEIGLVSDSGLVKTTTAGTSWGCPPEIWQYRYHHRRYRLVSLLYIHIKHDPRTRTLSTCLEQVAIHVAVKWSQCESVKCSTCVVPTAKCGGTWCRGALAWLREGGGGAAGTRPSHFIHIGVCLCLKKLFSVVLNQRYQTFKSFSRGCFV